MTDTTKTSFFYKSRLELFVGAATWLPAIGLFYLCVNGTFFDSSKGIFSIPIGWIGLAVASASLPTLLSDLLVRPALVVSLSPSGLRDWRVSPDEIIWANVLEVTDIKYFGTCRAIIIQIDSDAITSMQLSFRFRIWRKLHATNISRDAVWIMASWLQTEFKDLNRDVLAYARAHSPHVAASVAEEAKSVTRKTQCKPAASSFDG